MEELKSKLEEIEKDINELAEVTEMIRKETSIFELFDRVNKEVV